jgi:hypothetical protein
MPSEHRSRAWNLPEPRFCFQWWAVKDMSSLNIHSRYISISEYELWIWGHACTGMITQSVAWSRVFRAAPPTATAVCWSQCHKLAVNHILQETCYACMLKYKQISRSCRLYPINQWLYSVQWRPEILQHLCNPKLLHSVHRNRNFMVSLSVEPNPYRQYKTSHPNNNLLNRKLSKPKPSSGSDRAIAQAVSRWLPTTAARVRARVCSCGICGGQSIVRQVFSEYWVSPANL